MTQRERQLLEWIRENPMISQQELADKAGITRSSVAVHISNLMKKGCITGKGYIVRTAPYVAVVGGVNMDIGAVSAGELVARDSNPGHVTTSLGGVGRNIAHNLCLLGQQTAMVTVMGDDDFGRRVQENARDIGLDLSASAVLPDCRTGTYLYIAGPDGDMALAVNDMDIYQRMTPDFLRQRLDFINGADLVVLETNLPEDSIRWLCDNCRAPILADPERIVLAKNGREKAVFEKGSDAYEHLTTMIRSLMDAELDRNEQIEELGRKLDQTMLYMKVDEGTYLIYEYPADSYAPVYFFISDYPDDLLVCLASADPRDDVSPLCFTGVREVRDYLNKQ